MRVLVAEKIAQEGIDLLNQEGLQVDVEIKLTRQELLDRIANYDAIVVRSVTKVNEELYQKATNLKVVGRAGNGVDNIEMKGATERGIIVVNTPDSNTVSAAEHTIGLLISSCRNIPQANERIKARDWDRSPFRGTELMGKTLGVIGLGRIGGMVATRMQSFGMDVIAYDPYIPDERFDKLEVEKMAELADLMKRADIITIHTPKTEETFGMVGKAEFKLAKKGVRVVNCARGGLIDEDALADALTEGIVASAALDVLVHEPDPKSPLLDFPNTVLTPHLGADTFEAQRNVGLTVAQEVVKALRGEMVPNAVNLPSLKHNELEAMKAYLEMGEILGKIYHQFNKDPIRKIEIVYSGAAAELETAAISLAVLKGTFEPILKERVNYVNARLIADARGVTVTEGWETDAENYHNLLTVKITGNDSTFTIAGTIFGKREIRIVQINGFEFEVAPAPYMFIVENYDKPGMIGKIGTTLGTEDVNIATMQVSRNNLRQRAMMVLTVDSEVSRDSLQVIRGTEGLLNVQFIRL
jgi:D-3-phosphoglycerate dehydrogenase